MTSYLSYSETVQIEQVFWTASTGIDLVMYVAVWNLTKHTKL